MTDVLVDGPVLVEWYDSLQPSQGWQWLEQVKPRDCVKIQTVGFLVRDNDDHVALAASLSLPDEDGDRQVSGLIIIPRKCITRITGWGPQ